MPVEFVVSADQKMLLVASADPWRVPVRADALLPNHSYDVFVFLQNSDPFEHPQVRVGISAVAGRPREARDSVMRELPPIDVPPQMNGTRATVFVRFSFVPHAGINGHLIATILPEGPKLCQRIEALQPTRSDALRSGTEGMRVTRRASLNA